MNPPDILDKWLIKEEDSSVFSEKCRNAGCFTFIVPVLHYNKQ
jgi:hypothetical protein